MRETIPLKKRPIDWPVLLYFFFNLVMITYWVDLEQLVIKDPANFTYPLWPLPFMIDLVHWWGRNFDPLQWARPVWWKMTIWIDVILFGPFYAAGLFAFIKGKEWIRIPCFIWSGIMFANVTIIMGEEFFGPHASGSPLIVALANAPWFLFPFFIVWRMARSPHPFSREVKG
jgi:hypothetical protein